MKKIILSFYLTVCMVFMCSAPISANEENHSNITTVIEIDNIRDNVISQESLTGTILEGHDVKITNGEVYIDNQRSIGAVLIFIAGIAAGYLIDGVLIYSTGYSGGQLVANSLKALDKFASQHALSKAYLDSRYSTTVRSYVTTSGQSCSLNASGTAYNCAYSI